MTMRWRGLRGLPRVVWLLGFASLFNDISSEAIFPLLPMYLVSLGGAMGYLGLIEGSADALSSVVKVIAGRFSDRGPRRVFVVGGYAIPAAARAGIAAALAPWHVLAARLFDRLGKGIRSGPRDALLADAAAEGDTGRAFGLQRSMDHLGAAIGPLAAALLLARGTSLKATFAAAAALGLAAPVLLVLRLRDARPAARIGASAPDPRPATADTLPDAFWRYLALAVIFALGNSSDAFLLAKAARVGWSAAAVPLLWFGHHILKTLTGAPGGALSDRLPRRAVVAAGWGAYALAYLGFAFATTRWQVAFLFGFYALYHGLTEAAERAIISDVCGHGRRGRAFGWYHGLTGVAALPAGILTGWLWDARGPTVALAVSGGFAGLAAVLLALSRRLRGQAPAEFADGKGGARPAA